MAIYKRHEYLIMRKCGRVWGPGWVGCRRPRSSVPPLEPSASPSYREERGWCGGGGAGPVVCRQRPFHSSAPLSPDRAILRGENAGNEVITAHSEEAKAFARRRRRHRRRFINVPCCSTLPPPQRGRREKPSSVLLRSALTTISNRFLWASNAP